MPIRPENRHRYGPDWPEPGEGWHVSELLGDAEWAAIKTLRESVSVDTLAFYDTWERIVARLLDGTVTPPRHPWDVTSGLGCRVEVKFSGEHDMKFSNGTRRVFRFAGLRPGTADAYVLVGLDRSDRVWLWVLGNGDVPAKGTCTLNNPARAVGDSRSKLDTLRVPIDKIIPACHLHYDRDHHAEARRATREAELGLVPLFGGDQ